MNKLANQLLSSSFVTQVSSGGNLPDMVDRSKFSPQSAKLVGNLQSIADQGASKWTSWEDWGSLLVETSFRTGRKSPEALEGVQSRTVLTETPKPAQAAADIKRESPVVFLKQPTSREDSFLSLEKWEGYVLELTDDTFVARLRNLRKGTPKGKYHEEEAEFLREDVSAPDHALLQEGAIFYWSVGYRIEPSGQRHRESVVTFRRMPVWSERDLRRAQTKGEQLGKSVGWFNKEGPGKAATSG